MPNKFILILFLGLILPFSAYALQPDEFQVTIQNNSFFDASILCRACFPMFSPSIPPVHDPDVYDDPCSWPSQPFVIPAGSSLVLTGNGFNVGNTGSQDFTICQNLPNLPSGRCSFYQNTRRRHSWDSWEVGIYYTFTYSPDTTCNINATYSGSGQNFTVNLNNPSNLPPFQFHLTLNNSSQFDMTVICKECDPGFSPNIGVAANPENPCPGNVHIPAGGSLSLTSDYISPSVSSYQAFTVCFPQLPNGLAGRCSFLQESNQTGIHFGLLPNSTCNLNVNFSNLAFNNSIATFMVPLEGIDYNAHNKLLITNNAKTPVLITQQGNCGFAQQNVPPSLPLQINPGEVGDLTAYYNMNFLSPTNLLQTCHFQLSALGVPIGQFTLGLDPWDNLILLPPNYNLDNFSLDLDHYNVTDTLTTHQIYQNFVILNYSLTQDVTNQPGGNTIGSKGVWNRQPATLTIWDNAYIKPCCFLN